MRGQDRRSAHRGFAVTVITLAACVLAAARDLGRAQDSRRAPQPRPHGARVEVPVKDLTVDDGDTFTIAWAQGDTEIVRILGIDTPETKHPAHNLPEDQEWGPEARAFAQGSVAFADRAELLRSSTLDPYGRTLGYFLLDGRNYSAVVVAAHLAYETVSHYGDNGFPAEAQEVVAAAEAAGKPPFEPPHEFRRRMREAARGAGKP
jgi:micrococcal nuclease